jgi:proline racemase
MEQLAATGQLSEGGAFVHDCIIGSPFTGRTRGSDRDAIIPSIARQHCSCVSTSR